MRNKRRETCAKAGIHDGSQNGALAFDKVYLTETRTQVLTSMELSFTIGLGAFGVDFSMPSDSETYERDLLKVNRGLLKYGTTSYCPTIVSSSASVYHRVLSHLKPKAGSAKSGATVLGAHVEGPFINKARHGAHELKVLQASSKNGYKDFKDVYGLEGETAEDQMKLSKEDLNSVKIITLAPELEGVMDSIPDLVKAGITVSVGHSMANISQAEMAVQKGATLITHLFNAMPQFHHRDPGVIGLLGSRLDLPRPYYGLICDGIHVHPNSVKIAYDSHPEGVILVTDAMSAMGLPTGTYQLGNMDVTKEDDRVYIEGTDTLAGSCLNDRRDTEHRGLGERKGGDLKVETTHHSSRMDPSVDTTATIVGDGGMDERMDLFLPTPPGSTLTSPLKDMSSSAMEGMFSPSKIIHAIMETFTTLTYEEVTIHGLFGNNDHYHRHGKVEKSSRPTLQRTQSIVTFDFDDEMVIDDDYESDDDHNYGVNGGDEDEQDSDSTLETERHVRRAEALDASETGSLLQERDREAKPQERGSSIKKQDLMAPRKLKTGTDVDSWKQDMSDCGCSHYHSKSRSEDGMTDGPVAKTQRTNVNDDGDLCCPSSSVITLDACVRNFIQFTKCSLIEALEAVTLHPAEMLGIQETKGVIKPGADADLVLLDADLFVKRVFVAGEEVDLDSIDVRITERF
ncbi:hypothetical protein BGW38_007820 [Lunasporangiospora selenospora]|uniref:N-acetylglucosamine-6-phosphate deacetylase n=1 Tax=Lunasporangiospora selenospora TaxID=979761 RepID=A0A9P6FY92_9FUNG|nr:hypothetical protein BGW38_007820 [Lunasporangiospora selenospora]